MYARLPKNLDPAQRRVRIAGNWYGLKQGPRIWNDQLNSILLKLDFVRCPVHPCLYKRCREDVEIILGVHVDDGLMGCNKQDEFDVFITEFNKHVALVNISKEVLKYTGTTMEVNHQENWIRLSHSVYIQQRYADRTVVKRTPMNATINLRRAEPDENGPSLLSDTGTFRFIADRARPDILTAVGELSTGGSKNASEDHVRTSEQVKDYLHATQNLYIQLGGLGKLHLFAYSDASYITDGNCKSRLGGCVFMNWCSGTIFAYSRNDTIRNLLNEFMSSLSHSSTESEIKAIDILMMELIHILDLTRFIAGPQELPIKIYCDNKSAGLLFDTLKTNHKVKHINVRIQSIRELIIAGIFAIHFVPTKYNVADILTKALPVGPFELLRGILMLGHGGAEPEWARPQHSLNLAQTTWTYPETQHMALNAHSIQEAEV
jgi:hypothetical protein